MFKSTLIGISVCLLLLACGGPDEASTRGAAQEISPASVEPSSPTSISKTDSPQPAFDGFDFQIGEGTFWDYGWFSSRTNCAQGSGCSTDDESGLFRITLGQPRQIQGITAYEVHQSGNAGEFTPRWRYIAMDQNQILGSADGITFTIIFNAETGVWPGSGFFTEFDSGSLFSADLGQIENEFIQGPALVTGLVQGESNCEYFGDIGLGTICGSEDPFSITTFEYYQQGIGPIGYSHRSSASFSGGGFASSHSVEEYIGLVASSLTGDEISHEFEIEPNDSEATGQRVNVPFDIAGDVFVGDVGDQITMVPEVEENDSPSKAQMIVPALVKGKVQFRDPSTVVTIEFQDTQRYPTGMHEIRVQDWYIFRSEFQDLLAITLEADSTDIGMFLIDSTATRAFEATGNSEIQSITTQVGPGTYLVGVSHFGRRSGLIEYTLNCECGLFRTHSFTVHDWYTFTLPRQSPIELTLHSELEIPNTNLGLLIKSLNTNNALPSDIVALSVDLESSDHIITKDLQAGTYSVGVVVLNTWDGRTSYSISAK